ncbi:hypothetical protein [Microbacterium sp. NIBRBAC000506063]|uniref:hypothetical protein n=1 Tax=Microbacterium sp. NIBRBAC000506063 TaxID=2734618 RepID=UPI001BB50DA7|nr:hypothetical protein [Microbacterium sp. NIBRBAC000506063]QTV78947.1 hypothetical protein KAE78_07015 [Microbacterium sp. NIBRBAC000506063]
MEGEQLHDVRDDVGTVGRAEDVAVAVVDEDESDRVVDLAGERDVVARAGDAEVDDPHDALGEHRRADPVAVRGHLVVRALADRRREQVEVDHVDALDLQRAGGPVVDAHEVEVALDLETALVAGQIAVAADAVRVDREVGGRSPVLTIGRTSTSAPAAIW